MVRNYYCSERGTGKLPFGKNTVKESGEKHKIV